MGHRHVKSSNPTRPALSSGVNNFSRIAKYIHVQYKHNIIKGFSEIFSCTIAPGIIQWKGGQTALSYAEPPAYMYLPVISHWQVISAGGTGQTEHWINP